MTNEEHIGSLGNFGERQTSDRRDWGFYAHLSIYDFAVQFAVGRTILDVGSGTGYGARYVKDHGALAVYGVERDTNVVQFLTKENPDINFATCDLDRERLPYKKGSFDVVFSSNVLEHVAYVDPVLADICRVLTDNGHAIIAIPPIPNADVLKLNAKNIFHINNLPHPVWLSKLTRYFEKVQPRRHWMKEEKVVGGPEIFDRTRADVKDFIFPQYLSEIDFTNTITSIYVCSVPRAAVLDASLEHQIPVEWEAARVEAEGRQEAFIELQADLERERKYWRNEIKQLRDRINSSHGKGLPEGSILKHVVEWIEGVSPA